MSLTTMLLKLYFLSLCLLNVILQQFVWADDDEECSCVDYMIEDIKPCKDWENTPLKFDVKLEIKDHHGSLNGKIIANSEITEGIEITLVVVLNTPNGDELVYSAGADLCQTFKDEDAPWNPIVKVFNTTRCPIPRGEYPVKDVMISLHALKGFMVRDFCGIYTISVTVELTVKKYMCFQLTAEIFEETRPQSECEFPQDD